MPADQRICRIYDNTDSADSTRARLTDVISGMNASLYEYRY